jgi:hypothetical protein
MHYKRNQIEKAISRAFEASTKPASLRIRLKRLLETDRGLGRSKRSADPVRANFAFYSMEGPGRGSEVWFSAYEAFALLTGLRLMHHGWPQRFAVAVLRSVRPKLEKYHARTLEQDPASLLDEQLNTQKPRAGDLAVTHANPAFLAIRSVGHEDRSYKNSCAICQGQEELMRSILAQGPGLTWTILELAASVRALSSELAKTKPSKRGRGAE